MKISKKKIKIPENQKYPFLFFLLQTNIFPFWEQW